MSRLPAKILIVAIIGFWAVMTGWLVRAHWNDGNAPFSEMAPEGVFRQVLKHEVSSTLGIYRGQKRIGSVNITPVHNPANSVSLDGNISLAQGGEKGETYNFSLRFDLENQRLRPETITLRLSRREPAFNALIELLFPQEKVRYNIIQNGVDFGTNELPMSGGGLAMLAPVLGGLPPLPMSPSAFSQTLECRTNRAHFVIRGERMDGFRVRVSAAGLSGTATLGQLGEVFVFRTSTEYHLLAEGLDPKTYLP